jgi:hypothetical protein
MAAHRPATRADGSVPTAQWDARPISGVPARRRWSSFSIPTQLVILLFVLLSLFGSFVAIMQGFYMFAVDTTPLCSDSSAKAQTEMSRYPAEYRWIS